MRETAETRSTGEVEGIYTATRTGRKAHIALGGGSTFCGARVAIRIAAAGIERGEYSTCASCEQAVAAMRNPLPMATDRRS